MKKIPSLFKRDYEGNRQVYDEVVEGAEWVLQGQGIPTIKHDGTACMVKDEKLYKRYDRKKPNKPTPEGWMACEEKPNEHTGHWPGWIPVRLENPQDRWHLEAWDNGRPLSDGTYELIGPKIQGNPYGLTKHQFIAHGSHRLAANPRTFDEIKAFFETTKIEGIVWHHTDGRMVKIKRRDFGFDWP